MLSQKIAEPCVVLHFQYEIHRFKPQNSSFLNAKFIVFNAKYIVLNAKFIIFAPDACDLSKFIISNTKSAISIQNIVILNTKSVILQTQIPR